MTHRSDQCSGSRAPPVFYTDIPISWTHLCSQSCRETSAETWIPPSVWMKRQKNLNNLFFRHPLTSGLQVLYVSAASKDLLKQTSERTARTFTSVFNVTWSPYTVLNKQARMPACVKTVLKEEARSPCPAWESQKNVLVPKGGISTPPHPPPHHKSGPLCGGRSCHEATDRVIPTGRKKNTIYHIWNVFIPPGAPESRITPREDFPENH